MIGPITAEWLAEIGFKWHQFDRQPDKHWLLWLGPAICNSGLFASYEDLGIELAPTRDGQWFCWLRSDVDGRYSRFLHIRHLQWKNDLTELIDGIVGRPFDPAHVMYGALNTPERAAKLREEHDRLDRRLMRERPAWRDIEKDQTLGGALPEHLDAFHKGK